MLGKRYKRIARFFAVFRETFQVQGLLPQKMRPNPGPGPSFKLVIEGHPAIPPDRWPGAIPPLW
jgi:hypothetical protein